MKHLFLAINFFKIFVFLDIVMVEIHNFWMECTDSQRRWGARAAPKASPLFLISKDILGQPRRSQVRYYYVNMCENPRKSWSEISSLVVYMLRILSFCSSEEGLFSCNFCKGERASQAVQVCVLLCLCDVVREDLIIYHFWQRHVQGNNNKIAVYY